MAILQEQRNVMKASVPLHIKWVTHYDPKYEQEFFQQSDDIPRILEDRDILRKQ